MIKMKISDLEANAKVYNLVVTIESLNNIETVGDGRTLQEGIASDDSGQIKFSFWEGDAGKYSVGDKISFVNGWARTFQDELQVSAGKYGKVNLIPSEKIDK